MYILCLTCEDRPGIVSAVSKILADQAFNIEESSQFNASDTNRFFMRVVFTGMAAAQESEFCKSFAKTALDFGMTWAVYDQAKPVKTLLMVSQYDHCLHHLLYQSQSKQTSFQPTAIVSNHETCRPLAKQYDLEYHLLPVTKDTKQAQETKLSAIIQGTGSELVILARYMQILSEQFTKQYAGQIINIHHSFLPGFKGARPYHQAYERGVKMIGATAHFATGDLDEGPIISQRVTSINHTHTPEKMQHMGHDLETLALSDALKLYAERRIFIYGNKTIIL